MQNDFFRPFVGAFRLLNSKALEGFNAETFGEIQLPA
jgi:hypothetical protein